ncbi:MAG: glycosyltransferase [Gemmatimonadaceae bacterium]
MRIAIVSNTLPPSGGGGAEAYAAALADALGDSHDVVVVTGAETAALSRADLFHVRGMPDLASAAPPLRKVAWHLREQWLPRVHREMTQFLSSWRPDVVHTHEPQGLSAAVFTALARMRLTHVHTLHDFNLICSRVTTTRAGEFCGGRCLACLPQRLIRTSAIRRRLDLAIAPSQFIRDRHVELGALPAAVVDVIPHGTPLVPGRIRERGSTFTIGFIGSVAQHKGVLTLLDAVDDTPPDWRLIIAGDGPLLEHVALRAQSDSRFSVVGRVDGTAREQFFERIDVLAVPSEWEENAPLVTIEAAVRGIPVVASSRGGLREAPAAFFHDAGAAPDLRSALKQLDSSSVLQRASQQAYDRRGVLSWETHVATIERALADVVNRRTDWHV